MKCQTSAAYVVIGFVKNNIPLFYYSMLDIREIIVKLWLATSSRALPMGFFMILKISQGREVCIGLKFL
jgi:hypothetical protein